MSKACVVAKRKKYWETNERSEKPEKRKKRTKESRRKKKKFQVFTNNSRYKQTNRPEYLKITGMSLHVGHSLTGLKSILKRVVLLDTFIQIPDNQNVGFDEKSDPRATYCVAD